MIVLVPLPLFNIIPPTGEPGIMTDCVAPALPVTRPGPREVITPDGAAGDSGATPVAGAPIAGPPIAGACARTVNDIETNVTAINAANIVRAIT
jgi:hypothetical protein